jgi:hypothetical protein
MKIAFLCSSLEPGRDGVGDYTRTLAGELVRLGHQVFLIALNDRWITGEKAEEQARLQTLRFGPNLSIAGRVTIARQALDQFAPDWVSLQYVCYGFHPKGLPWRWSCAPKGCRQ